MEDSYIHFTLNIENYSQREVENEVSEYREEFRPLLSEAISQFQEELSWDQMWKESDVNLRMMRGYSFFVLILDNKIRGWIWLTPEREIKNYYVHKDFRKQGHAKKLYFKCLNKAKAMKFKEVWGTINEWNVNSLRSCSLIWKEVMCPVKIKKIKTEYKK